MSTLLLAAGRCRVVVGDLATEEAGREGVYTLLLATMRAVGKVLGGSALVRGAQPLSLPPSFIPPPP